MERGKDAIAGEALGMKQPIARRDFLNGVAVAAGASMVGEAALGMLSPAFADATSQEQAGYYPPARTGLRGSHPGSFKAAHAVRDGALKVPPGRLEGDEEQ